uniref:glycosyltransferase family 2 protein n=1 Tax=Gelidibacter sp. TaxID=2018083 RepID=UPI00404A9853
MNEPLLVSIITIVYNGEKYLQQTIDSVHNQTYKNIEYIIIDGGSTDKTLDIIKQNKDKITTWISEADNGLYDAMNKGIKLANGKLIGTINSDDWYELDAVELSVSMFLKNKFARVIHANRYDVYPNGKRVEFKFNDSVFKFKYFNMTYSHPSMFVVKEEYDKHLYNTVLNSHSDYQFTLEVFLNNQNAFVHIPKPLVNFRLGGVSSNLSFLQEIHEGFYARKSAGMNILENLFSICLLIFFKPLIVFKKKLNKTH